MRFLWSRFGQSVSEIKEWITGFLYLVGFESILGALRGQYYKSL